MAPHDFAQDYWIVIPAYNEAATVRDVASRARLQCTNVVVVDDGSTDGTAEVLAALDVTVLRNETNCGKAGSLVRGFDHAMAQGAVGVITLDADGQHAPEEIPLFLDQSAKHPTAFLIGARRCEQRKTAVSRYVANRIADFWINWAAGLPIEDSQSGFRLYPASLLRTVSLRADKTRSFVFESEILIEAARRGINCRNVEITVTPRSGPRPSHFRPLVDILRITQMVAWKLLSRGLYLRGLWISLRSSEIQYTVPSFTKGE
ncbi:MAG: glycosyltransferase family 2 protein [Nitrospira sp.]|jgi:glycosyltransferase involved in cell wall biosynthesis|nr:glycosyltransferase family 2 protein [Nitrospira sp.]MDH4243762.1 glycosyltransferase family 2 protein [Nitrospira sp.]MDH4356428.1 glycosyltransferase family 2 protein [Nitrospira sp.]MDH5318790.1 glycosyltransferase family 2 protein [Nitrospira sp.]